MMGEMEVILVTGGAGCLGQHIVRLLQEKSKRIKEIRVFDIRSYANKLGNSGHEMRGGYQAYSPLSTTHDHFTDCNLDSVVCAGVAW